MTLFAQVVPKWGIRIPFLTGPAEFQTFAPVTDLRGHIRNRRTTVAIGLVAACGCLLVSGTAASHAGPPPIPQSEEETIRIADTVLLPMILVRLDDASGRAYVDTLVLS